MRRKTLVAGACAIAMLAASACSAGSLSDGGEGKALELGGETVASQKLYDAAKKEGTVNIYTSVNEVATKAMQEAFTEDTGIKVSGVRSPTGRLNERILSEYGAKSLPADIIAMPDDALWKDLVDKKMFVAHKVPNDADIPEEYKGANSLYYAFISAPTTLAFNKEELRKAGVAEPKSWRDLLDPKLKGEKIGIVHASQGAGGWNLALFMRDELGDDYWQKLADQKPLLESSVGSLGEKLGRGEVAIAAARPGIAGDLADQGAPVGYVWASDGVPMFNFFIGQVAKSEHPNAAQVYMNWAMSKRGQSVAAKEGGDYSVNPKAAKPETGGKPMPPIDEIKPYTPTTEKAIGLREKWIAEWNKVFGYRG